MVETMILNSYNNVIGIAIRTCETTSGGVNIAETTNIIRITNFLYFLSVFGATNPSWVSKIMSRGNSNTKPKDNNRELTKLI